MRKARADPWEEAEVGEGGICGDGNRTENGCQGGQALNKGSPVATSKARGASECSIPGPHGVGEGALEKGSGLSGVSPSTSLFWSLGGGFIH